MARDYKHRASPNKERKPVAIWVWLLMGFLAGAGSVGFLCLQFAPDSSSGEWIGEQPESTKPAKAKKKPPKVKPPSFEFYNELPNQEVVVPEEELVRESKQKPRSTPQRPQQKPVATASGRKYLIQVGSVRSAREADALKAKLAFLGLQARVSRAKVKGATWYRVRLGPFASSGEAAQVRKRLSGYGYDSLVVALR